MDSNRPLAPIFRRRRSSFPFLIASHKGSFGGNILPNTTQAFAAAIRQGADLVEGDIEVTKDGQLVFIHSTQERMYLATDRHTTTFEWRELKTLAYRNNNDVATDKRVQTVDEVFAFLKEKNIVINLDRCWHLWESVLEAVDRHGIADQILLKSPAEPRWLEQLESFQVKYQYMPFVRSVEDFRAASGYDVNLVAAEVIYEAEDSPVVHPDFLQSIRDRGALLWVNSLNLYDYGTLSSWEDDDTSLLEIPEEGWGRLVDRGFDIIQTDWPAFLKEFRQNRRLG